MRHFIAGLALVASFPASAESIFPCLPDRQSHAHNCRLPSASHWVVLPVVAAGPTNGGAALAGPERTGRVVSLDELRRDAIWRNETAELLRRILR